MTTPTSITEFAQAQLDIIEARRTAINTERASLVDDQAYWEGIGGQQGTLMASRATAGIARIDLELARLTQLELAYTKTLTTGVFSLGRKNPADEWIP